MLTGIEILFTFLLGVSGYVYSGVLTEPEMILNRVFVWCENNMPAWLAKPLITCFYCVSGQLAFWTYVYYNETTYSGLSHFTFICLTIFVAHIASMIWSVAELLQLKINNEKLKEKICQQK
jgi:hypothetical protein